MNFNVNAVQNKEIYTSESIKELDKNQPLSNKEDEAPSIDKPRYDEFIHSADSAKNAVGIYKPSVDEEGNMNIKYSDPEQAKEIPIEDKAINNDTKPASPEKAAPKEKSEKSEKCTVNTDKVDREIEQLKKKAQQLQQQITNQDDPKKAEQLRKQLDTVNAEISMKDNDAYRKQHSTYTFS